MPVWRRTPPSVVAAAACLFVGACASLPPSPYSDGAGVLVLALGIEDRQPRFREIFCTILEDRGSDLPDVRPCDEALTRVSVEPADKRGAVDLGRSDRRLVAVMVQGVGWDCFSGWLGTTDSIGDHLRQFGFDLMVIPVESLSSSERNAEIVRETLMAMDPDEGEARHVLIGYSKGAPDILTAVVDYPEIRDRVAAVVSVAGAVAGSPVAEKVSQSKLELLRHWPKADCPKGDRGAMGSLLPETRQALIVPGSYICLFFSARQC